MHNCLIGFKLCRFDDDKTVSGIFEELWEENISGESITLQLYMKEIVALLCENISASSWASKKKVKKKIIQFFAVSGYS